MTPLAENKASFDAYGITAWHRAGYTGKRGCAVTHERPSVGPAEVLFPDIMPPTGNSHPYWTSAAFLQICPDAKLYSIPFQTDSFLKDKYAPWFEAHHPDVAFASVNYSGSGYDDVFKPLTRFCTFLNSIGNTEVDNPSQLARDEAWYGVAAVDYINGAFVHRPNSWLSDAIDIAGAGQMYVPTTHGAVETFSDTSCATPFIAGMCHLVNDLFLDKVGRALTASEMMHFMKEHRRDIGPAGKDNQTGLGVFILPDPTTINPFHWIHRTIHMRIGDKTVYVDGKPMMLDQPPIFDRVTNRTLVPVRFIAETLGAAVDWNSAIPLDIFITT
jgi:hypothetical protein